MERIYQMRVVPDLLSSMHPSIDVRITVSTLGMVSGKANQIVVPGSFLLPRQVCALYQLDWPLIFLPFDRPLPRQRYMRMSFIQTYGFIPSYF